LEKVLIPQDFAGPALIIFISYRALYRIMAATTTICLEPEVKELLNGLKIHPQESYNSVVKRLAKNAYDWEPLSEESIKQIEDGLRDYRDGKCFTHEEVWGEIESERRERAGKRKVEECTE
jgi:predicted transcriptional regulator